MGLVCMVWGQGRIDLGVGIDFKKIPRLVDPVAAIGSLVAASLEKQWGDANYEAELWGLIWAIGACSAVW
jgi:hypothetical protein